MSGKWIVVVGRQEVDRDSFATFGFFDSEDEAQEYIEEAHDPDGQCDPETHLLLDDAQDAEVAYINVVRP